MTLREKVKHSVQFPFSPAMLALCCGFRVPGVSTYKPCSCGSGFLFLKKRFKTPIEAFFYIVWYDPPTCSPKTLWRAFCAVCWRVLVGVPVFGFGFLGFER